MSYPHMPGEGPMVNRMVADSLRAEAAGKVKATVDYLISILVFVAAITVARWPSHDWTVSIWDLWLTAAGVGLYVVARCWWLRRKLRAQLRPILEVDHQWPDSK